MDDFRDGVGQATRADVVNRENGIVVAQRHAAINHFLGAALDFRVAALHRGEIEVLVGTARRHTGRCAAAQAN